MNATKTFGLAGIGLLAAASVTFAADESVGITALAERLIELRSEVETLNDELDSKQQQHKNRLNALAQRQAGLESELQSKQLQLKKIVKSLDEKRAEVAAQNEASKELVPVVESVGRRIKAYVDSGLPFQLEDRRAGPDDLVKDVAEDEMTAPRALNRMWSLLEDEFRIAKENGLFRQEVVVEGTAQLSDVLRLGSIMMFFRTPEQTFGVARRQGDGWVYEVASGAEEKLIDELFKNFEKQVRTGFFELPNGIEGSPR
ncbi:MAG: DUF3450 family protein [Myxococcota bacterium]